MKRILLGTFLSIFLLLIFAILLAPAKFAVSQIQERLPSKFKSVKLYGVKGTVWSPIISVVEYNDFRIENIRADISPLSLLFGDLKSDLLIDDLNIKFETSLSASNQMLLLEDTVYQISAETLNPLMQYPVKALSGDISGKFETASLKSGGQWQEVNGQGVWASAQIDYLEQSLLLGDLEYEIIAEDSSELKINIINNKGPLDLKGKLLLTSKRHYHLDITTTKDLPDELNNWISRLGKLQDERYRIQWKGQL